MFMSKLPSLRSTTETIITWAANQGSDIGVHLQDEGLIGEATMAAVTLETTADGDRGRTKII